MAEHDMKKTLFRHEVQILDRAKNILIESDQFNNEDLINQYRDIVKEYEKLLKMTIKAYKISDIQGRMLKEQETEITRVNTDLKKVEESRKRFISDISHEMGAPIRAILSFLKIIVDGKAELEPKYIQLIYERITVVNELLKDLFDLSILEVNGATFSFEPLPVQGLIKQLCSKYEIDVKAKGIQFIYLEVAPGNIDQTFFIQGDRVRLEQVITNLINNAIKFTPTGGTISVIPALLEMDSTHPRFQIKISDTGFGIKKESLPFIFERFYKGNKKLNENGTGLGLAISKEIILKHQGSIDVYSEENVGSTFIIELPVIGESEL